jgi:hypothetical protein
VWTHQVIIMCDLTPDCDGALYYDQCEECGSRLPDRTSTRTNVHLPSEHEYKRQKRKLARD